MQNKVQYLKSESLKRVTTCERESADQLCRCEMFVQVKTRKVKEARTDFGQILCLFQAIWYSSVQPQQIG